MRPTPVRRGTPCRAERPTAPAWMACAISRPSMRPPDAMTGSGTAAAIPRTRSSVGIIAASNGPANVPRWAPASLPCATIASTPASASSRASSTVVAVPMMKISSAFNRAIAPADGIPKVKLKAAGRASITASNCWSNGSGREFGKFGWWQSQRRVDFGEQVEHRRWIDRTIGFAAAGEKIDREWPAGQRADSGDGLR